MRLCRLLPAWLALVLWATAAPASAHAVLVRSMPSPHATLDAAPDQVVLVFNEPVDPTFSSVTVFGSSGERASARAALSKEGETLTVSLGTLGRGVYTVKWRVLSAVDGHITSGVFVFGVGQAPASAAQGLPLTRPDPVRVAVRWGGLLAAILLVGATFFQPLVLRAGLSRIPDQDVGSVRQAAEDRLRALTVLTSGAVLLFLGADLLLQARALLDVPVARVLTGEVLWPFVSGTKPGWSTLFRVILLPVLVWPRAPRRGLAAARLVVGACLLAGFTMTAHASGQGLPAMVADWLHLLAVTLWIGGLAALLLVLQAAGPADRRRLARVLVPRFSTLAGFGLGAVVLTGLYGAWLSMPALRALTLTSYGRALFIKLLLVLPLIMLGAINRFVLRPQLAGPADGAGVVRRFARLVTGEVGLGAAILLVVAVLTITPPAKVTLPAGPQQAVVLAGLAEDLRIRLTIAPAQPGWNRYELVVRPPDGGALDPAVRLLLRFVKLDEDLTPVVVTLTPAGEGRYAADGGELAAPGWWELEVVVRQRGRLDASTHFPLRLGLPAGARADAEAEELLQDVREAPTRSWREYEQLTDGIGSLVITRYEIVPPDRLHYRTHYELEPTQTTGVTDVVIIGADRYERKDTGAWKRETLRRPLVAEGHRVYMRFTEGVARGRQGRCDAEPCQVLLWANPGGRPAFAAWVGLKSLRAHRLYMLSVAHYMTLWPLDFEAPLSITPPRE